MVDFFLLLPFAKLFTVKSLRFISFSGDDGKAAKSKIDVAVNEKIISENVNNN